MAERQATSSAKARNLPVLVHIPVACVRVGWPLKHCRAESRPLHAIFSPVVRLFSTLGAPLRLPNPGRLRIGSPML